MRLKFLSITVSIASALAIAAQPASAAPKKRQPSTSSIFKNIKFDGDCQVTAKITNWNLGLKYSYQLPSDAIGFGFAVCKDGSEAYFIIHEKVVGEKHGGVHAANLGGYINGTANDIYGTYGFYKKVSVLPAFWSSAPIPLGYSVLAVTKSPKSQPLVLVGMAFGIEISTHKGALHLRKASKAKVLQLIEKWEGRIFDGQSPFDQLN